MHVFLVLLAVLCLVWTALSFLPPAVSDDGDASRLWRWVYAFGAIVFGIASFFPH